jgi:hypothetical protein
MQTCGILPLVSVKLLSTVVLLANRVDMVQIPGKRTRLVPILIMPAIRKAMDLLVDMRQKHTLMPNNRYFFASDSQNGYLDQWQVLKSQSDAAGLKRPDLIRSTRLRKYMATVAQVIFS